MITYQNSTILFMIALPNQGILGKGRGLHTKQDYYSRYLSPNKLFYSRLLTKTRFLQDFISYQKYYISNVQTRMKIYCHILFLWALINASIS